MLKMFSTANAVLIAALALALAQARAAEVGATYSKLCSTCHGNDLEGGLTDSLLDDQWKHGADDTAIARIIRDGDELGGMPGFRKELTDGDIRALVVFIREKGAQAKQKQTPRPPPAEDQVVQSEWHRFRVRTVVNGLKTPWSMAFPSSNKMFIAELPGTLRTVEEGRLQPEPVAGTPRVLARGQGGLMEVALHPRYADNGWVYLAYTETPPGATNDSLALTALVRGRIRDNRWSDEQLIFRAPAEFYRPGGVHFGCRIAFDGTGHLFFAIGERGRMQDAQDLTIPNGKVHRLLDDGRIPPENPFAGQSNAIPSIWTYGNRNPQGLDFHPVTGDLWETEHGPRGGDELNLIQRGRNYGWPLITYGMNYDGTPLAESTERPGLEQPVIHWTPSIAVCGIDFYEGDRFPKWKHDLLVTALAQQELRRVSIQDRRVIRQEILFKNLGRVRDVHSGPDGLIYVALNNPDRIVRLEPVEP